MGTMPGMGTRAPPEEHLRLSGIESTVLKQTSGFRSRVVACYTLQDFPVVGMMMPGRGIGGSVLRQVLSLLSRLAVSFYILDAFPGTRCE